MECSQARQGSSRLTRRAGTTVSTPLQATILGYPETHGGVSGGAAWRIDLPIDGSGRKSVILEGVVFAEGPEEDRKLIAQWGKQRKDRSGRDVTRQPRVRREAGKPDRSIALQIDR